MTSNLLEVEERLLSIWNTALQSWQDEESDYFEKRGICSLREIISQGITQNNGYEAQLNSIEEHLGVLIRKISEV